jgi:hypothetical protein
MKFPVLITLLLLYFVNNLFGQTVVKGIVTDDANQTIPFAAVYLSKTTIGTMTNKDGAYKLTIPQEGEYELVSSFIGYKSSARVISVEGKNLTINIRLTESPILLNEITVKSKDRNREQNYALFNKLFLGETVNALNCKILNPEDLYLYREPNSNLLKGQSRKSLRIENRALGYTILYDLNEFTYDSQKGLLKFTGSNYFIPLTSSAKFTRKWARNRLAAYYGSRIHFLRSLYLDSLNRENFRLYACELDSARKDTVKITPIREDCLRLSRNAKSMTLFYAKPLFVSYLDTHAELYSGLFGFQPQRYKTTLEFSDTLTVYKNGFFPNPYNVTWFGEMAVERVADMVPFDFQPNGNNKISEDAVRKADPILTASSVEQYLSEKQKSSCRDQLFVQLDRNIYKPGDTIFFQAYIRDRFTGIIDSKSASLYALLTNERRILVDSSRYKIDYSTASGWIPIPVNAELGKYHFTAFTSQMQNGDPVEAFQLDLYVNGVNSKKVSMVKDINQPSTDEYIELQFLPEGGTFVEGVVQRVGFNATNNKGEPVPIEGLLKNNNGTILDTIQSGIFGPGDFVCTAKPGLYVELTKGAGTEKIWPLPEPSISGLTLSVTPVSNNAFAVEIQSNHYGNERGSVSGTLNMVQFFSQDFMLDKKQRFVVETGTLPSGVANITLFDNELKPVAERLVFLNSEKRLQFKIQPDDSIARPGQETELAITITDGLGKPSEGFFSIAVTDSVSGIASDLFAPGIEYTYHYHPSFPGNLPPKILAEGVECLTAEERDLLLMVYGWTKISWDLKLWKSDTTQLIDYDLLKLKVLYANKKKRVGQSLDLISLEGISSRHLVTDQSGEISLPLDSLSDMTRSVIIMPDAGSKSKATGAMLSIPYNEQYFKSDKLYVSQPVLPYNQHSVVPSDAHIAMDEKTIEIAEVTVIGQRTEKVYHDEYEKHYQANNVKSLDYEQLWSSSNLETAIRKLTFPYKITPENIYLRSIRSVIKGPNPALIVLDGMPIYEQGWPRVNMIPPSEVTSLTILHSKTGVIRYGEVAMGGVIFINTRSSNPDLAKIRTKWNMQNKNDKMMVPINIYRPHVAFYNPTRADLESNPLLQGRATIYWQSEVYFGGKEPVKIRFPNLKHKGPVVITVNGMSVDNLVGSGRGRYVVE